MARNLAAGSGLGVASMSPAGGLPPFLGRPPTRSGSPAYCSPGCSWLCFPAAPLNYHCIPASGSDAWDGHFSCLWLVCKTIWRLLHSQVWHLSCNDSKTWFSWACWAECPGVAPPCSSGSSQDGGWLLKRNGPRASFAKPGQKPPGFSDLAL